MSTLNDNDLFLVERSGTSHSVTTENLMSTIQDDDLMLVERNGVSYKVTGEDVKDQLGGPSGAIESPVAIISPEDGAGMSNASVYPAAEGITGVDDETFITGPTYSTKLSQPAGGWAGTAGLGFDGDPNTRCKAVYGGGSVNFSPNFGSGNFDVTVYVEDTDYVGHTNIDGNYVTTTGNNGRTLIWRGLSTFNQLKLATGGGGERLGFYRIQVNGETLIDDLQIPAVNLTYTTDKSLNLLTEGHSMTQQPAYTPVTDTITNVSVDTLTGTYDIKGSSSDGQAANRDEMIKLTSSWSASTTIETVNIGARPTVHDDYYRLLYKFSKPVSHLKFVRYDSALTESKYEFFIHGSNDGENWTFIKSQIGIGDADDTSFDSGAIPYQYYQLSQLYEGAGATSYNDNYGVSAVAPITETELTFATPKDIVNFRPGDVVQAPGVSKSSALMLLTAR